MSFKKFLQFNLASRPLFFRKSHSYATIGESNDAKNVGKHTKIQVKLFKIC